MIKKNVAVIFGGCTVEHEVSIITGLQFIENMNKEKYNAIPVYISNQGIWYMGEGLLNSKTYKDFDNNSKDLIKVYISPVPGNSTIQEISNTNKLFKKSIFKGLDVIVPAMHGMNGEDGTLQGLLELSNIPYVGSGVLGSSVGMDKVIMKSVFKGEGLPVVDYVSFLRAKWETAPSELIKDIEEKLEYPVYVKPANLGSSIGISKAKNADELKVAIDIACNYDRKILVEQGVQDIMEVNCSALGYDEDVITSVCEEPTSWEEFLTFEDKYMRGGKSSKGKGSKGMAQMDRKIPADISNDVREQIEQLTSKAFKALDCRGVARIDYILDKKDNKIYINEINTIPGSFSFYLCEHNNIKYAELIDRLIDIAIKVNKEKNKNKYSYSSPILDNISSSSKH